MPEARYRGWRDGLTTREERFIRDYTVNAAPNPVMRGSRGQGEQARNLARQVGIMEAALDRAPAPPPGLVVYRNLTDSPRPFMDRLLQTKKGEVVKFDGLMSTTADASKLLHGMGTLHPDADVYWMEILPKRGAFVDDLSAYKGDQSEFLMHEGTYLRYVGKRHVKFRGGKELPKPEVVHQWEEVMPDAAEREAQARAEAERVSGPAEQARAAARAFAAKVAADAKAEALTAYASGGGKPAG